MSLRALQYPSVPYTRQRLVPSPRVLERARSSNPEIWQRLARTGRDFDKVFCPQPGLLIKYDADAQQLDIAFIDADRITHYELTRPVPAAPEQPAPPA